MSPAYPGLRLVGFGLAFLILSACGARQTEPAISQPLFGSVDPETRQFARHAIQAALENRISGDTESWQGPHGRAAHITPLRTFRIETGHYCREFALLVQASVGRISAQRTACRSPEGEWIDVTSQQQAPET